MLMPAFSCFTSEPRVSASGQDFFRDNICSDHDMDMVLAHMRSKKVPDTSRLLGSLLGPEHVRDSPNYSEFPSDVLG